MSNVMNQVYIALREFVEDRVGPMPRRACACFDPSGYVMVTITGVPLLSGGDMDGEYLTDEEKKFLRNNYAIANTPIPPSTVRETCTGNFIKGG